MYENLAILAAFVFLYSLVSGGLEKTPFNGAVVFAAPERGHSHEGVP